VFLGDIVYSYDKDIKVNNYTKGDSSKVIFFQLGALLNCIERIPTFGGAYSRSAGAFGKIIKKHYNSKKVLIELPSKILIYLSISVKATLGTVCNEFHNKEVLGKAGRARWLGRKSIVRGVAMNPIDHPNGGGEGKKSIKVKKTPWGNVTKWKNRKLV
jgi:large subunit ribosomal protein L2